MITLPFTRTSQPNTTQLASKLDAALRKQSTAQAEVDRAQDALSKATEVVDQLRAALNQHLNPPSSQYQDPGAAYSPNPPSITQGNPSPTQAAGVLHKQPMQPTTTNRPQANPPQHAISSTSATRTVASRPAANSATPEQQANSTLYPKHVAEVAANRVATAKGMCKMLENRVQYSTDAVEIVSVQDTGVVKLYGHYVSGDGTSSGIPSPEGYRVEHKVSKTGKAYRLVYIPALEITCTLSQALPTNFQQCKDVLREWLQVNEWLKGKNPDKLQFTTKYNHYQKEYSPYVTADGINTTLYIYIGTESLSSTTPAPTLIA